jgi:two-component system cell cycle response regulator DivK
MKPLARQCPADDILGSILIIMAEELILIVEDNEKSRRLLRDILRAKGYQTIESVTAEEGIQLAKESLPALVLMDIQLPGINGMEARLQLRADPKTRHIPVVAVTASAMLHDRSDIENAGFDGFQSKPIDIKKILKLVRDLIDQHANVIDS